MLKRFLYTLIVVLITLPLAACVNLQPVASQLFGPCGVSVIYRQMSWAPDGQQIVFSTNPRSSSEIVKVNRDGTGLRILASSSPFSNGSPSWSPDGKLIAFSSNREYNFDIFLMDHD